MKRKRTYAQKKNVVDRWNMRKAKRNFRRVLKKGGPHGW